MGRNLPLENILVGLIPEFLCLTEYFCCLRSQQSAYVLDLVYPVILDHYQFQKIFRLLVFYQHSPRISNCKIKSKQQDCTVYFKTGTKLYR